MKMKILRLAGLISAPLVLALSSSIAQAIAVTDVTFRIPPEPLRNADAAVLLGGNDSLAGVNALGGAFAGDPWALLDKTDDTSQIFSNVTFELTADPNVKSGNWELSWSGSGLPLIMDFVFVTKAASNWGAYLFETQQFAVSPDMGEGTFDISWTNRGGNIPDLSHASIYGRLAEGGDLPPPPPPPEVPLPGTHLLLALGLLGLLRRRHVGRRHS